MSDNLEENKTVPEGEQEELSENESTGGETAEADETDIPGMKAIAKRAKKGFKKFTEVIKGKETNIVNQAAVKIEQPMKIETLFYKMDHPKRGHALIFNHFEFSRKLALRSRNGTDKDCEKLKDTLKMHGFEVSVHNNCDHFKDIKFIIEETIKKDQSICDCIAISVLTHGKSGDKLYARNEAYGLSRIMDLLTADNCPSLAGKPKLFFIQACRGDDSDTGSRIAVDSLQSRQEEDLFRIPNHADFFVAHATIPGYVSWRNQVTGSIFIQTLCRYLQSEDSYTTSILQLTLGVTGAVAFEFESQTDEKCKQIPSFTSRLTKDLILSKKQTVTKNANGSDNQQTEAMETD